MPLGLKTKTLSDSFFLSSGFIIPTGLGALFFLVFHSFLLLPIKIEQLGGTASDNGFIMGISGVSMLFLTPLSGILADRYGRKPMIITGFAALFFSCAGFVFVNSLDYGIYLLRMLQGAAFPLFFTAAGALVAETAPESRKAQSMGIYGMFAILSYAVAPYAGKTVVDHKGFSALFFLLALLCLAGFIAAFLIREVRPSVCKRPDAGASGENKFFPPASISTAPKRLIAALVTIFLSGWVFLPAFSFVALSSQSVGVEKFYLYFVSFTVAVLFVRLFFGWVPDKYGTETVCPPFIFLSFLSFVFIAFSDNPHHLVISGALFGISHGVTYPSLYTLAMESAQKSARARVFSICSLAFTSGGMFGTFVSGEIALSRGYFVMYMFLAGIAFITFSGFTAAFRTAAFRLVKSGL